MGSAPRLVAAYRDENPDLSADDLVGCVRARLCYTASSIHPFDDLGQVTASFTVTNAPPAPARPGRATHDGGRAAPAAGAQLPGHRQGYEHG